MICTEHFLNFSYVLCSEAKRYGLLPELVPKFLNSSTCSSVKLNGILYVEPVLYL